MRVMAAKRVLLRHARGTNDRGREDDRGRDGDGKDSDSDSDWPDWSAPENPAAAASFDARRPAGESVQCRGQFASGERCTRMTLAVSGYCHAHAEPDTTTSPAPFQPASLIAIAASLCYLDGVLNRNLSLREVREMWHDAGLRFPDMEHSATSPSTHSNLQALELIPASVAPIVARFVRKHALRRNGAPITEAEHTFVRNLLMYKYALRVPYFRRLLQFDEDATSDVHFRCDYDTILCSECQQHWIARGKRYAIQQACVYLCTPDVAEAALPSLCPAGRWLQAQIEELIQAQPASRAEEEDRGIGRAILQRRWCELQAMALGMGLSALNLPSLSVVEEVLPESRRWFAPSTLTDMQHRPDLVLQHMTLP